MGKIELQNILMILYKISNVLINRSYFEKIDIFLISSHGLHMANIYQIMNIEDYKIFPIYILIYS